mmetsp:Transcript_13645/g.26070  ORF Transcript_13645/g.26070 Transcript_13645/m.26070 type:complete len:180 (-) Transcript_13645:212-751(-)
MAPNYTFEGDPKHRVSGPGFDRTLYSVAVGAGVGTFFGACNAAWYPDPISTATSSSLLRNVGRMVTRPAMWCALAAGTFTGTECVMEMIRNEKQDAWNSLVAGMAGGSVVGLINGRPQIIAATAIGTGIFMAALDLSGPKTVFDEKALDVKRNGFLPEVHVESAALASLKEKFPQHKDL